MSTTFRRDLETLPSKRGKEPHLDRVRVASPSSRETYVPYKHRPWVKYMRDVAYMPLSGGIFERHLLSTATSTFKKERVSRFFIQCGGLAYGVTVAFFLLLFLLSTIYYEECEFSLSLFLALVGCINCLASALFCACTTYSYHWARALLYLIGVGNMVALVFAGYFLSSEGKWETVRTENEIVYGIKPPGVVFCRQEMLYAAWATLGVLSMIVALQVTYVLLLMASFVFYEPSEQSKYEEDYDPVQDVVAAAAATAAAKEQPQPSQ